MRFSTPLLSALLLIGVWLPAAHAGTREYAVEVSAVVQDSPPRIDLSWPADPTAPEIFIYRRTEGDSSWSAPIAHLDGSATSFTDSDVICGRGYEYAFRKTLGFFSDTIQVPNGSDLTFAIYDAWHDGMCCYHGLGAYEVAGCGVVYAAGGSFGAEEITAFTLGSPEEPCNELIVNVTLDVYGQETTWRLSEEASGAVLAEGGPYAPPHFGHLFAGIKYPAIENRGTILLLVEESLSAPLADRLQRLEMDLIADGYQVRRRTVNRNDEVPAVKALILAERAGDPSMETLFLLGRIPVPYSGNIMEHSDHCGAWPADTYYGELDGTWTDLSVNNTTASRPENHNIPGDGKFDQTFLPSDMDLQVGRVDLANMSVFAEDEQALIARYLDKNHAFRAGQQTTIRRGLIDDNVGELYGLAPAATGWRYFTGLFGAGAVSEGDFFPTLESESYLWCYGCGAGSYTSCAGVGTSYDFATRPVTSVFTSLYG
ncbi:MAG: hypothetical protein KJ927_04900, partial [Candidatus Eisenbacteria bacterium]|nr:hypothetical protein [Candidatus Eisenbacteria bacterium]